MCGRSHWTLGPGGCLTSERSCVKLCLLERMFAFVNQVSVSAASKSKQATGRVCGLHSRSTQLEFVTERLCVMELFMCDRCF